MTRWTKPEWHNDSRVFDTEAAGQIAFAELVESELRDKLAELVAMLHENGALTTENVTVLFASRNCQYDALDEAEMAQRQPGVRHRGGRRKWS